MSATAARSLFQGVDKYLVTFEFELGGLTMERRRLRFPGFWLGLIVFALTLSAPERSLADGLSDSRPNRFQCINPGSYSPCHYWFPSLYTFRAYHRPARLYDQAEWDAEGHQYSTASNSCTSPGSISSPQKKADGQN